MKKFLAFGMLLLAVSPLLAKGGKGTWDFGGSVGLTQIGGQYYPYVSVSAEYRMSSFLSWLTRMQLTMREMGDSSKFDLSVPSNLLWYPLGGKQKFDPYLGPGVTYTHTYDGDDDVGGNITAGVDFLFIKGKKFGIRGTYTYYLYPEAQSGGWQTELTGSWSWDF